MTRNSDGSFPEISDSLLKEGPTETWHMVDWKAVNKEVRRIRSRIFVHSRNGNTKQLRALQRLFLRNRANILYSIRVVTSNAGSKTAGVDEVRKLTPPQKLVLFDEICALKLNDWSPPPVRRIYIDKPTGGQRPVGIPTIKDRVLQTLVLNALEPEWEAIFEPHSYGFRPGRCVADAVTELFVPISNKKSGKEWIVECDIKGCFDNVSHEFLMSTLEFFPAADLIRKWLSAGYLEDQTFVETPIGFPQGGAISPLLCNIALHGLQKALNIKLRPNGWHRADSGSDRIYLRYADDFLVLCKTYEDAQATIPIIEAFLLERGLTLKKAAITHLTQGFDFLGFNVRWVPNYGVPRDAVLKVISNDPFRYSYWDRSAGIILAAPAAKSVKKVKAALKEAFEASIGRPAIGLIRKANLIIKGWAESKINGTSSRTFKLLDNYLYTLQWQWIRRNHPNKGAAWRKNRYFRPPDVFRFRGFNWTFHAPGSSAFMYQFGWFRPYDHLRVIAINCKDDPLLRDYWADLVFRRFRARPVNEIIRKTDHDLLTSQYFVCPVCEGSLLDGEDLHVHHIAGRAFKDAGAFSNLVLLHAECHNKVHYSKDPAWVEILKEFKELHPRVRE